jgi:lipopolysaccharide/colanic/teichoic acid biosynthesis glycosyltransferase
MMDIILSASGLVILSPLILFIALRVMFSSNGPILYTQERVGYQRRKFLMYKFRSMYVDAEDAGPLLASENDKRITPWGRFMRRWKLDEIPQLWNVLAGDMSIVGPRPEREYFINQLEQQHQPFNHLFIVKPGLTSLGVVKFGYAANTAQMAERLKFDLAYLEKRSLSFDIRIIIDTFKIIVAAKRK